MMLLHIVNTVCVAAVLVTCAVSIVKHLKNYRKPMDQRLIVRILLMVPLFSTSAYLALYCRWRWFAYSVLFFRELYEAFVIYTFYSLLTNLLGGEREIIFTTTGRPPVHYFCLKLDISDPHTYLFIKRLVMQYVWMRPIITVLAAIVHKSKTFSVMLIVAYNISVTLALNALMAFWVCLKSDLKPYRVILKFLSVKMIVFFSYWQTLALKIAHSLGLVSTEALAKWGNTLLIWESVAFAVVHWYAFPASDYNATFMFGYARLRIDAAFKDASGIADLIHDFRVTFVGSQYGHRNFDSVEAVLDHPDSLTRKKRLAAGLRYKNGGRSKYWLPTSSLERILKDGHPAGYGSVETENHSLQASSSPSSSPPPPAPSLDTTVDLNIEDEYSEGEEHLYSLAKGIYGDYNYPVAVVRESEDYVSFQERMRRQHILQHI